MKYYQVEEFCYFFHPYFNPPVSLKNYLALLKPQPEDGVCCTSCHAQITPLPLRSHRANPLQNAPQAR
ncbi:hypothetical protein [Nostoc sp. DedQUE09]|uniref:hypothetical protein n=1 Tax=Nostoc sp. DedQUE09 TaxID=3075394 RepID=UPI002AD1E34A|nr:hypothetical protein [Nostoc sp. DedQUE09]MDZ7951625.1 hypothetical protein [Nostoc sp. DedQUE09]